MKSHFSEEEILKTNKHIKRGITSLIVNEIQIKMRYISLLERLAWIKMIDKTNEWKRCGRKGPLRKKLFLFLEYIFAVYFAI